MNMLTCYREIEKLVPVDVNVDLSINVWRFAHHPEEPTVLLECWLASPHNKKLSANSWDALAFVVRDYLNPETEEPINDTDSILALPARPGRCELQPVPAA
jgi:hypothetical protein